MTTTLIFLVTALLSHTLAAPPSFIKLRNAAIISTNGPQSCRLFTSPSKCVGGVLPIQDKEPWCHYRMCSPSYVAAEDCPSVDLSLQATDKCIVEKITRDIYKCDGKAFGHAYIPVGCIIGQTGCRQVATCSCMKHKDQTSIVLKQIAPFKPDCPTSTTNPTTTTPTTTTSTTTPTTTTTTTTPTTTTSTTTQATTTTTVPTTTTTTPAKPTYTPPRPTMIPGSVNFVDCAKCGQVLECYVNSGSPKADAAVCDIILDATKFCTGRRGRATACGQQCSGSQGVQCFPGESWGTCPAVLGSKNGAAKCKGGAGRGRPAALSNFASYAIKLGTTPNVLCMFNKCDSGSTCPCANPRRL